MTVSPKHAWTLVTQRFDRLLFEAVLTKSVGRAIFAVSSIFVQFYCDYYVRQRIWLIGICIITSLTWSLNVAKLRREAYLIEEWLFRQDKDSIDLYIQMRNYIYYQKSMNTIDKIMSIEPIAWCLFLIILIVAK